MTQRMPCGVTDGEQFENPIPGLDDIEDDDTAYQRIRQHEIDAEQITDDILKKLPDIARSAA